VNFDEIITLVKEAISTHGAIDIESDKITLNCNDVDHIAHDVAVTLYGRERRKQ